MEVMPILTMTMESSNALNAFSAESLKAKKFTASNASTSEHFKTSQQTCFRLLITNL